MNTTVDRRRIFIFVAIAYGISIALAVVIFLNGGLVSSDPYVATPLGTSLLYATMLSPAVANIATRLITREGWSNTLLRPNLRRGWRIYLAAWVLPLVATFVGGAIYYLLFPSRFDLSMQWARTTPLMPTPWKTESWAVVTIREITYSLMYAPAAMFLMLGEEFGWRAYLLPKLMPLGPRRAVLLVGAIWAVWHWPAIFLGYEYGFGYWGAPLVGPLLFVLVAIFMSAFYAWVTLRTGSVWPAAIGHAVNNAAALMMVFFLKGEWDRLIGPATVGIIGSLGYGLLALLIFFSPRALEPIDGPQSVEPKPGQAAATTA